MSIRIGIGLTFVSGVLTIISMAIPYWWCVDVKQTWLTPRFTLYAGLFKYCIKYCETYGSVPDWANGARAMIIMSLLALALSFVIAVLVAFHMKKKDEVEVLGFRLRNKPRLTQHAFISAGVAATLGVICIIIVVSKGADKGKGSPGASFYLELVAILGAVAAGVYMLRYKKELESSTTSTTTTTTTTTRTEVNVKDELDESHDVAVSP